MNEHAPSSLSQERGAVRVSVAPTSSGAGQHHARRTDRTAGPAKWYVTARHPVREVVGTALADMPFGPCHLKAVGATKAACGASVLGWTTFWTVRARDVADLCASCVSIVSGGRAS